MGEYLLSIVFQQGLGLGFNLSGARTEFKLYLTLIVITINWSGKGVYLKNAWKRK